MSYLPISNSYICGICIFDYLSGQKKIISDLSSYLVANIIFSSSYLLILCHLPLRICTLPLLSSSKPEISYTTKYNLKRYRPLRRNLLMHQNCI